MVCCWLTIATLLGLCLLHDRFGNRKMAAQYAAKAVFGLPTESFDPTFEWAGMVHAARALAVTNHKASKLAFELTKEMQVRSSLRSTENGVLNFLN